MLRMPRVQFARAAAYHLVRRITEKVRAMPRVESSMIRRIEYEEAARELEITFTSGRTYIYAAVPKKVYEQFLKAPSKGRFFNDHIKDEYDYC
jgi:hypothetical protein